MIRKVQLDISDTNSLFSDITALSLSTFNQIYNENADIGAVCVNINFKRNIGFLSYNFQFLHCIFSETVKLHDFLFRII
jgi:hypothetical protein